METLMIKGGKDIQNKASLTLTLKSKKGPASAPIRDVRAFMSLGEVEGRFKAYMKQGDSANYWSYNYLMSIILKRTKLILEKYCE